MDGIMRKAFKFGDIFSDSWHQTHRRICHLGKEDELAKLHIIDDVGDDHTVEELPFFTDQAAHFEQFKSRCNRVAEGSMHHVDFGYDMYTVMVTASPLIMNHAGCIEATPRNRDGFVAPLPRLQRN